MKAKNSTTGLLANQARVNPPAADELEISFFGPSYGESVVLHVGDGQWLIVDSCLSPSTGEPQALEYLKAIRADFSRIRAVVATHWDNDHIRGLSQCLVAAPNADFIISGAFSSEDFTTILRIYDKNPLGVSTGLEEIDRALRCARTRGRQPVLAFANKRLLEAQRAGQQWAEVVALSPSDATVLEGHLNIGKLLQEVAKHRGRVTSANRNDRSIVLWIRLGNAIVLLGSDLEEAGDRDSGWSAITFSNIKKAKATAFKVPHHGPNSSHLDEVSTELLEPNPPSVVTPWKVAARSLPTRQDVERLQGLTDQLYVTTIPQNKRRPRSVEVDQMVRLTALDMGQVFLTTGQVRLRARAGSQPARWTTEMFNGAKKIEGQMAKAFFDPLSHTNRNRPWLPRQL